MFDTGSATLWVDSGNCTDKCQNYSGYEKDLTSKRESTWLLIASKIDTPERVTMWPQPVKPMSTPPTALTIPEARYRAFLSRISPQFRAQVFLSDRNLLQSPLAHGVILQPTDSWAWLQAQLHLPTRLHRLKMPCNRDFWIDPGLAYTRVPGFLPSHNQTLKIMASWPWVAVMSTSMQRKRWNLFLS